ncbi:MAG: OsmC family protein [Planctomycetota bacterium]
MADVQMSIRYDGDLSCSATHGPSGGGLTTDAPKDNEGLGRTFSPTDLLATSLATCVLTTMAIVARRDGYDIEGTTATVTKTMTPSPRRVGKLAMTVTLPPGLDDDQKAKLDRAAHACPVHRSLNPDTEIVIEYVDG